MRQSLKMTSTEPWCCCCCCRLKSARATRPMNGMTIWRTFFAKQQNPTNMQSSYFQILRLETAAYL